MNLLVFQNLSDLGILLEIIGFLLVLLYQPNPTYSDLFRWKKSQRLYKLFFGEKKYQQRVLDNTTMDDDDTITKSTGIALEQDNMVPKAFLRYWKWMRKISYFIVIIGLILQFSWLSQSMQ